MNQLLSSEQLLLLFSPWSVLFPQLFYQLCFLSFQRLSHSISELLCICMLLRTIWLENLCTALDEEFANACDCIFSILPWLSCTLISWWYSNVMKCIMTIMCNEQIPDLCHNDLAYPKLVELWNEGDLFVQNLFTAFGGKFLLHILCSMFSVQFCIVAMKAIIKLQSRIPYLFTRGKINFSDAINIHASTVTNFSHVLVYASFVHVILLMSWAWVKFLIHCL